MERKYFPSPYISLQASGLIRCWLKKKKKAWLVHFTADLISRLLVSSPQYLSRLTKMEMRSQRKRQINECPL